MKSIARVLAYLKYYPWQIAMNVLFNVLHIVFNLGSYVMIVPFVELLFGMGDVPASEPTLTFSQEGIARWAFWHLAEYKESLGVMPCLLWIAGGYLACSLLSNLFRYLALYFLSKIRNGVIEHLRNDLYRRITILPVGYFDRQRRGDIISRMSNDLADVEWSVVSTLQSLVKDPINIVVFCAALLFVSWQLFVLFLVVLPGGVWIIARIGHSLKVGSQQGQTRLGRLFAMLEESLASLRVIRLFDAAGSQSGRFRAENAEYARVMTTVARRRELSSPLSEILGTLALVIILVIGGSWVVDGHVMPSVFIFFVIVFARLIPPIQAVVKAYNSLQKGAASAGRFMEVLDADEEIVEKEGAETVRGRSGSVEMRDVTFCYRDGEPVLKHVNLTIPRGMHVAIVGPSGSGKSTLVDLLPRFHDVTEGCVMLDGKDIRDLNINSLRSQFGLVSQDCILFNDTVSANIAFGLDDVEQERIEDAARRANADEFIRALPQGYDTLVGDRGLNLSGGQRQRISIARALLRDTPILIMDEATSALDSESERLVQQSIDEISHGRTTITIAHRLATVRHADMIVVVSDGRIVECGRHEELVASGGMYSKLVGMQAV